MKKSTIKKIAIFCILLFLGMETSIAQIPNWKESKIRKKNEYAERAKQQRNKIDAEDQMKLEEEDNRSNALEVFASSLRKKLAETVDSMRAQHDQKIQEYKAKRAEVLQQQEQRAHDVTKQNAAAASKLSEERKKEAEAAHEAAQKKKEAEERKKKEGETQNKPEENNGENTDNATSKPKPTEPNVEDEYSKFTGKPAPTEPDVDDLYSKFNGNNTGNSMSIVPDSAKFNLGVEYPDQKPIEPDTNIPDANPDGYSPMALPDQGKTQQQDWHPPMALPDQGKTQQPDWHPPMALPDQGKTQQPDWHPPMALPDQGKTQQNDIYSELLQLSNNNSTPIMEYVHGGLDFCGIFPGIGEPCDLVNGATYLFEGNKTDAALSFGSAVPFLGYGATTAKGVKYGNTIKYGKNFFPKVIVKEGKKTIDGIEYTGKYIDGKWYPKDLKPDDVKKLEKKFGKKIDSGSVPYKEAHYKSRGEAFDSVKKLLGKKPVEYEPGKFRSRDGKWQFRAKDCDIHDPKGSHLHVEEIDPNTGPVLRNIHLFYP